MKVNSNDFLEKKREFYLKRNLISKNIKAHLISKEEEEINNSIQKDSTKEKILFKSFQNSLHDSNSFKKVKNKEGENNKKIKERVLGNQNLINNISNEKKQYFELENNIIEYKNRVKILEKRLEEEINLRNKIQNDKKKLESENNFLKENNKFTNHKKNDFSIKNDLKKKEGEFENYKLTMESLNQNLVTKIKMLEYDNRNFIEKNKFLNEQNQNMINRYKKKSEKYNSIIFNLRKENENLKKDSKLYINDGNNFEILKLKNKINLIQEKNLNLDKENFILNKKLKNFITHIQKIESNRQIYDFSNLKNNLHNKKNIEVISEQKTYQHEISNKEELYENKNPKNENHLADKKMMRFSKNRDKNLNNNDSIIEENNSIETKMMRFSKNRDKHLTNKKNNIDSIIEGNNLIESKMMRFSKKDKNLTKKKNDISSIIDGNNFIEPKMMRFSNNRDKILTKNNNDLLKIENLINSEKGEIFISDDFNKIIDNNNIKNDNLKKNNKYINKWNQINKKKIIKEINKDKKQLNYPGFDTYKNNLIKNKELIFKKVEKKDGDNEQNMPFYRSERNFKTDIHNNFNTLSLSKVESNIFSFSKKNL